MLFSIRASADGVNERDGDGARAIGIGINTGVTVSVALQDQANAVRIGINTGVTVGITASPNVRLPISTGVVLLANTFSFRPIQTGVLVSITPARVASSIAINTGVVVSINVAGQPGFSRTRDLVVAMQGRFPEQTLTNPILLGIEFTDQVGENEFKSTDNNGFIRQTNAEDVQFVNLTDGLVLDHNIVSHDPVTGRLVFDLELSSWTTTQNFLIRMSYGSLGNIPTRIAINTGIDVDITPSPSETTPAGWPYPQSNLYQQLVFNRNINRWGQEGDQWHSSIDSSNRVLVVGGDGNGLGPDGRGGTIDQTNARRTEWRVSRFGDTIPNNDGSGLTGYADLAMRMRDRDNPMGEADPEDRPTNSKPRGVLAFDANRIAVFYQMGTQPTTPNDYTNWEHQSHVALSGDNGGSFQLNRDLNDYIFRCDKNEDMVVWGVLQLDPGYVTGDSGIDDDYIYVYLGDTPALLVTGYAAGNGNDTMWMARVRWRGGTATVNNLLEPVFYEMFTGMVDGEPTWGAGGVFGTAATRTVVYNDDNGMAVGFQVGWHSAINKFVLTYIHAGIGSAPQGIAVAISDSPWDETKWRMIGYVNDLQNVTAGEEDAYLACHAPSRWNSGTSLRVIVSTYEEPGGGSGDNLIVTSAALTLR